MAFNHSSFDRALRATQDEGVFNPFALNRWSARSDKEFDS